MIKGSKKVNGAKSAMPLVDHGLMQNFPGWIGAQSRSGNDAEQFAKPFAVCGED
jgi:hypothetical protein